MLVGLTAATFVCAASNGGDSAKTVTAYSNLAAASIRAGDNQRAEEYARQSLEMAQRTLPARHRLTAVAFNNLAQSCRFQEKYMERSLVILKPDAFNAISICPVSNGQFTNV